MLEEKNKGESGESKGKKEKGRAGREGRRSSELCRDEGVYVSTLRVVTETSNRSSEQSAHQISLKQYEQFVTFHSTHVRIITEC